MACAVIDDTKDLELNSITRDGVVDRAERRDGSGADSENVQRCCLRISVFLQDFKIWEFPQVGIDNACRTLTHQETVVFLGDKREKVPRGWAWTFSTVGKLMHSVALKG